MPEAAWLIVVWLIVVGAAVGSFLNVVVYRLPIGLSLVHPPSHCPKCGKRIAWYDNMPVLGWLMLRGRCRQCHNPISPRYPIIEAITAAMFGAVALAEMPYMTKTGAFGLYPFHMLLLCTLLCAALIEYDGGRVPWKLFAPALIVGIAALIVWPEVRPTLFWPLRWLTATTGGLIDLGAGALWGGIGWLILTKERPRGLAIGLTCAGLFLGWEAVTFIGCAIAPMWLLERVSTRLGFPSSVVLGVVTLAWVLTAGTILSMAGLVYH